MTISRSVLRNAPAEAGVFALGVLPHDEEIDVARLAPGQWARHTFEQPHRPEVDVLIELTAELEQRLPHSDT